MHTHRPVYQTSVSHISGTSQVDLADDVRKTRQARARLASRLLASTGPGNQADAPEILLLQQDATGAVWLPTLRRLHEMCDLDHILGHSPHSRRLLDRKARHERRERTISGEIWTTRGDGLRDAEDRVAAPR